MDTLERTFTQWVEKTLRPHCWIEGAEKKPRFLCFLFLPLGQSCAFWRKQNPKAMGFFFATAFPVFFPPIRYQTVVLPSFLVESEATWLLLFFKCSEYSGERQNVVIKNCIQFVVDRQVPLHP